MAVYAHITDSAGRLLLLMCGITREWVLPGGDAIPYESEADATAYHVRRILHISLAPGEKRAVAQGDVLFDCGSVSPHQLSRIELPERPPGRSRPEFLAHRFVLPSALPEPMRAGHRRLLYEQGIDRPHPTMTG
ncbi:hypothetical protein [Streptomyces sp. NPDC037389]|uniref:hypothetical protein n=1 Tax=Streptomyces sp. NPDC037389 TaxID=3155369 RepID=UPI0034101AD7